MENIGNYPQEPVLSSKILITGPVSPLMPYIVLKELALECNFLVKLENMSDPNYYIKVFKKISKIQPTLIHDLQNKKEFEKAVDIVNPLCEWSLHDLKSALCFLNYFKYIYQEQKSFNFYSFTPVGLQTPNSISNINACIYYGLCRHMNIQVPLDISYEELKHKVVVASIPLDVKITNIKILNQECEDDNISIDIEIHNKKNTSKESDDDVILNIRLIDETHSQEILSEGEICDDKKDTESSKSQTILLIDPKDLEKDNFNFSENFNTIQTIGELFEDVKYLRNQFAPINDEQAIVAGAIVHHRDFSYSSHPLEEFKHYVEEKRTKDKHLRYIELHNPHYLDLNYYFNPYLPISLYKKQLLDHHLDLFSYPSHLFIGLQPYEILQELHLEENFYLGWHPNIINKETPIELDNTMTLTNEIIVCYGIKNEFMNATSWYELNQLFKNTNLFINPFQKNTLFHRYKIERLLKLAKWILEPSIEHRYLFIDYDRETIDTIKDCVDTIETMLLFQKSEFEMVKEYVMKYEKMDDDEKNIIHTCLEKLFELCMFMRGWNTNQSYPISNVPSNGNEITEKNSLEALIVLDEWNYKSDNLLYSLPLIIWKNEFVISNLKEQGLTIGERIAIVKTGETDNINSCIRMSSNVLGASYCFYCKLFKIPEKFDIKDLTYIQ